MAVRNVVAPAPQPEPASRLRSATRDVSFLQSDSRCRDSSFSGLGIAATNALLQIFGIFSWELRKSQNRDLRADLAWSINSGKMESNHGDSGKMESNHGDFLGSATANSSSLKGSEIL